MESKKKKSITPRSDLYLFKSEKEEILKKNRKKNHSKRVKIHSLQKNIHSFQPTHDELIKHFQLRKSLIEKLPQPKTEKEWNEINTLSECYANQILLQVKYHESVEKRIQQILGNKK